MLPMPGIHPKGGYSFTPGKIDMNIQRRLLYGLASVTAWYAGAGHALGLGDLTLQSALNQPLQATIQLHDSEGLSPADVVVALADAEAFSQLGMERPFSLTDLRFTPVIEDRELVIRVESTGPVKEPYLNFLVQLKRANGSLLREYTLLLDPPLYQPAPVMASSFQGRAGPATPPGKSARPTSAVASARTEAAAARLRSPAPPQPGDRYQTVAGDSLWAIASATRAESVSVQQQKDAIGRLNPHAFVKGDPSRLRVGQVLTLPAAQKASPTPAAGYQNTRTEPVQPQPEQPSAELPGSDRLRIDDLEELQLSEEEQLLHERLMVVEKRLMGLLGELELRDAQIARAEAELKQVQQRRAAELLTADSELDAHPRQSAAPDTASMLTEQGGETAGGVEGRMDWPEPDGPRESQLAGWWPVPAVLLTALLGALLLRARRKSEPEPLPQVMATSTPQPITVPGSRVVDPLEGVELYLAYGRLPEAQIMLNKAIMAEPQRLDLRLRLLSVLAELGDLEGCIEQEWEARELGADQAQIDRVKAHHRDWVEEEIKLDLGSLDSLEQNWETPDEDGDRETDVQFEHRRS